MYDPLSRRFFLRGLGGFTLSIPFLPSLLPRAHAQTARAPLRYVQAVHDTGIYLHEFFPKEIYDPMTPVPEALDRGEDLHVRPLQEIFDREGGRLSAVLGPEFRALLPKMNMIRGLDVMDRDGHNLCAPTTASTTGQDTALLDSAGQYYPPHFPASIDVVLEESDRFYATPAPVRALRMLPAPSSPVPGYHYNQRSSYSWRTIGGKPTRIAPIQRSTDLFAAVFGKLPAGVAPAAGARNRSRDLASLVLEQYKAVQNGARIGADDKALLANYIDLLGTIERNMAAAPVAPAAQCARPAHANVNPPQYEYQKAFDNFVDITVAALVCGATRVACLSLVAWSPGNDNVPHTTVHDRTHRNPARTPDDVLYTRQRDQFRSQVPRRIAEALDKFRDVDGNTILDNTILLWCGELTGNGHHSVIDMPVVTFGGGRGKLRTGLYLDYRQRQGSFWRMGYQNVDAQTVAKPARVPIGARFYEHNLVGGGVLGRPYNNLLTSVFHCAGLGPQDYQRFGREGFGVYDGRPPAVMEYYAKYLGPGARTRNLPYLVRS
jgi:hypothetical protein